MVPVNINHIRKFIKFAQKELKLPSLPQIKFVGSTENKYDAFGHSLGKLIVVRVTDRHPIDICRTIAHELLHYKEAILKIKDRHKEDTANEVAGRVMQKYDTTHPEVFRDKAIRANMLHEDEGLGPVAANHMGDGGGVKGFDPLLSLNKAKRRDQFNLKNLWNRKNPKPLRQIIKGEMKSDKI